ncbi:NADH-quinone oxidoreductase subunit K [Staphylococcus epidermidis]|uniref:NADH-quinone oxidoreductase subunit K n=1 Tax=Staphylococcus epidermidis TaxID=1282 RepID=UPI0021B2F729|nr:NADH-quinone oxidoreductase subunit K [Staphylococcus epidermidis]
MLTSITLYLVFSKSLIRIIIPTTLLTHPPNLFLITIPPLNHPTLPIFQKPTSSYLHPIPQPFILTPILIPFPTTPFFLLLPFTTYKQLPTHNVDLIKPPPQHHTH